MHFSPRWLLLLGCFAVATPAMAGKDDEPAEDTKGDKDKDDDEAGRPVIEMTGLTSIDEVFGRAKAIDDRLATARKLLQTAKVDLNTALALEKGTPLKDGLADLKAKADGKIHVAMNGNMPKLEADDALPANVKSAVDATNRMVDGISGSIEQIAGIPAEATALVAECQALPARVKDDVKASTDIKVTEIPAKLKIVNTNVGIVTGLPEDAVRVGDRMKDILVVVAELAPKKEEAAPAP